MAAQKKNVAGCNLAAVLEQLCRLVPRRQVLLTPHGGLFSRSRSKPPTVNERNRDAIPKDKSCTLNLADIIALRTLRAIYQ
jgi:hypothetical protein